MLTEIHIQLEAWAYWALSKSAGGYPKMSAFMRMPGGSGYAGFGNIDQDAWEVDLAVRALPTKLQQAVKAFYLGRGTLGQRAQDCGCCRNTFMSRVENAQESIRSWMIEKRRAAMARRSASV